MSDRCDGCRLAAADCLCLAAPVESRLAVLVVVHPLELGRASNTGRLAPLVLARAALAVFGPEVAPASRAVVLAPGGPLATAERLAAVDQIVALDGTWGQARRMRARHPSLAALPSLSLPARPGQRRLRRPRDPSESSTAEALAIALEIAGDRAAATALRRAVGQLVDVLTRPGRPRGDLIQ